DYGETDIYVTHPSTEGAATNAVTISGSTRPGANATKVAEAVLARVEQARQRLPPAAWEVTVTRNYGATAAEKASELLLHLPIAPVSVTLLIGLFLGWREAVIVLVAVPVTLGLTLFVYYAMGYSLNR